MGVIALLCWGMSVVGYAQTINRSFNHNGMTRAYQVHLPPNYSAANRYPLIMSLHEYASSVYYHTRTTAFDALADTAGVIMVYPSALGPIPIDPPSWNSGEYPHHQVDDVGFLSALLDTLPTMYAIDSTEVYAVGFGNGATMCQHLICETGRRFAGVALVAGTLSVSEFGNCIHAPATSILQIHGTSDPISPYGGDARFISVQTLQNHWLQANNLSSVHTVLPYADVDQSDSSTADLLRYEDGSCHWVHHIRVNGGGNRWPGTANNYTGGGHTNQDISATHEIWKFFRTACFIAVPSVAPVPSLKAYFDNQSKTLNLEGEEVDQYALAVYNMQGQLVFHKKNVAHQSTLPALPKGAYVAQWTHETARKSLFFLLD